MSMQPLRPLAGLNNNQSPIINSGLRSLGSAVGRAKSVFDNLKLDKIGSGRLMIDGSYYKRMGGQANFGLKGQLMSVKKMGRRTTTKNLSFDNLEQIHDIISDQLKKKAVGSKVMISRHDKINIMKQSRQMVKTEGSHFTWQDRDDLKKIVNTIRKQAKDNLFHHEVATEPSLNASTPVTEHLAPGKLPSTELNEPGSNHKPVNVFE